MGTASEFAVRVEALGETVARPDLRPADDRRDWPQLRDDVRAVRREVEALIADAPGDAAARRALSQHTSAVVALLYASGDRRGAVELLQLASPIASDAETAAIWAAAATYLQAFTELELARWWKRQGNHEEAARLARALLDHPAPPLATVARALAGRGAAPARPSRASRSGGAWLRDPATWKTAAIIGALTAAFVAVQHYTGPGHELRKQIDALRPAPGSAALSGDERDARVEKLSDLIDSGLERDVEAATLARAATAMVDVVAASLPALRAPAEVDEAIRMLARLRAIPDRVRDARFEARVAEVVRAWLSGAALTGADDRALRLCLAGRRLIRDARTPLDDAERTVRERLAARLLAEEWAADAFRLRAADASPTAAQAAAKALVALGDSPSVWLPLAADVDAWLPRARTVAPAAAAEVDARLRRARDHRRPSDHAHLVESQDAAALKAALARSPGDQELAVALAATMRDAGDAKGAIAMLEALGPVGRLSRPAQTLMADLREQTGDLAAAEAILDRVFSLDFPPYEDARDRYRRAAGERRRALAGDAPAALGKRFDDAPEDTRDRLVDEWLTAQVKDATDLRGLRDDMTARAPVVGVALRLGMVRLARAHAATGDDRQALLARAEQDFLAVAADAAGSVAYHLNLGQVYHRMGKHQQGDRELRVLLDDDDRELHLEVARVYRDLGVAERATEIATRTYEDGPPAMKPQAAMLLYLLAPRQEDKELWLGRADQNDPHVRANLRELEGHRLRDAGDLTAADAKYAEAVAIWSKNADASDAAANNAALAAISRYRCTGDPKHVDFALRMFSSSVALAPTSAIAVGNAAPFFRYRADLRLLERFIDTAPLRLAPAEADDLVSALARGPLGDSVVATLKASADARRAVALFRQQEVLAPGATDAYYAQRAWFRLIDDPSALAAMEERLRRQTKLDVSQEAQAHQRWIAGSDREQAEKKRRAALDLLRATEARLPAAEASVRARRTRAALSFVRATLYEAVEGEERQTVEALQTAFASWPELGDDSALDSALIAQALVEASAVHPPFVKRFADERRGTDPDSSLYALVKRPDAAGIAVLRKTPAFTTLVERRRAALRRGARGTFADWGVGRIIGDEALVAAGRAFLSRPVVRLNARVGATLAPYAEAAKRWLAIIDDVAGVDR